MSNVSPLKLTCKGFTLSELLVSLAVLGLIAGLTVPTVWASVKQSQDRALFKTTIRTLNEATMRIASDPPALPVGSTTWDLYDLYLNSADDDRAATSFTLPGGVVVGSFNEPLTTFDLSGIVVDVNGSAPPNAIGKDKLFLTACFSFKGNCAATQFTVNTAIQESGTVGPLPDSADGNSYTGNVAFYNSIMATR